MLLRQNAIQFGLFGYCAVEEVEEEDGVECDDGEDEDKDDCESGGASEGSDGDENPMVVEAGDGVETPVGVAGPNLDRAESLD